MRIQKLTDADTEADSSGETTPLSRHPHPNLHPNIVRIERSPLVCGVERVQFCNIWMQMNIRRKNGRGLVDVTTPTETNGDLSIRTIFGCGSGFGYGQQLRGRVCPLDA